MILLWIHPVLRSHHHEGLAASVFDAQLNRGQQKARFAGGLLNQLLAGSFRESSSLGDDFMHPENTTSNSTLQAPLTTRVDFLSTPIDNRGIQLLSVTAGANAEDALRAARTLSSGLSQLCQHMRDSLDMGELAYCDGMAALCFLGEAVSALVWSAEKSVATANGRGGEQ
ncbi:MULTISPECIES: hypothetical protein [Pseudomonas]|uniref:hypothetical protein n=1 Tax=Pseudomonas TaxID=286 RepID=UPI0021149386|nr:MULTISPECIES: hypothetical protein [Pseudomonas]